MNLNDSPTSSEILSLIKATTEFLELKSNAFIEKDFYITNVIHAMSEIQNEHFHLVLIGGTGLSKAHQITQRMSEDLDFKLYPRDPDMNLLTDSTRKKLSVFRESILKKIQSHTGLAPQANQIYNARNNRYIKILLDYNAHYPVSTALKPQIQIELTTQHAYTHTIERKSIGSLIYHAFGEKSGLIEKKIDCASLMESSGEKWSALLKHLSLVNQNKKLLDATIVRHLYDLCCIEKQNGISEAFEEFVPLIILKELERLRDENPYLHQHLMDEVQQSFNRIKNDSSLEKHYQTFINDMVFQKNPPSYSETLSIYETLNHRAFDALKNHVKLQENLPTFHHEARIISAFSPETIVSSSLREKLLDYADAQKKQQQLLWAHYEARSGDDRSKALEAKETVSVHFSELTKKSVELYNDPEIKTLIQSMQHVKSAHEAVSWDNVKAQLLNDQETHHAIAILLPPIKRAGFQATQALSQYQSQHKGGGKKR